MTKRQVGIGRAQRVEALGMRKLLRVTVGRAQHQQHELALWNGRAAERTPGAQAWPLVELEAEQVSDDHHGQRLRKVFLESQ